MYSRDTGRGNSEGVGGVGRAAARRALLLRACGGLRWGQALSTALPSRSRSLSLSLRSVDETCP